MADLSALLDGELDARRAAAACARWREDPELRGAWHAWNLIGDVLRSDELASTPQRDGRLVAALRERLAAEPVVLAPAVSVRRRSFWMLSSAVAAGFAAVAATVFVLRQGAPGGGVELAQSAPAVAAQTADAPLAPSKGLQTAAATAPVAASGSATMAPGAAGGDGAPQLASARPGAVDAEPVSAPATLVLIRDARLDRYLAAHKQFAGSSALGQSPGYLRAATTDAAGR